MKIFWFLILFPSFFADVLHSSRLALDGDSVIISFPAPVTGRLQASLFIKEQAKPYVSEPLYLIETSQISIPCPTGTDTLTSVLAELTQWKYVPFANKSLFGSGRGQFRQGVSISSDEFGHLFVIDRAQDQVLKFDSQLELLKVIGGFRWDKNSSAEKDRYSIEEAGFDEPFDLSPSSKLSYYISDSRNGRVIETDLDGNFLRELNTRDRFDEPTSIQVSARNELFVMDSRRDRIQVFNSMRQPSWYIGGYGRTPERLNKPRDFVITREDELVVLDTGNRLLKRFTSNARFLDSATIPSHIQRLCTDSYHLVFALGKQTIAYSPDLKPWPPSLIPFPEKFIPVDCTSLPNGNLVFLEEKNSAISVFVPKVQTDRHSFSL
ncbi:MAG: NHL repeat-containing protein [Candidatus Cloacimonetes bacterium]|nr:NHL repeat-containing protein [Candidatus Cloacimonadota bacterium]